MPVRTTLLRPHRIERDGRPIHVDLRKAVALLAYLAVGGRPQSRHSLSVLLWPDADGARARGGGARESPEIWRLVER